MICCWREQGSRERALGRRSDGCRDGCPSGGDALVFGWEEVITVFFGIDLEKEMSLMC